MFDCTIELRKYLEIDIFKRMINYLNCRGLYKHICDFSRH